MSKQNPLNSSYDSLLYADIGKKDESYGFLYCYYELKK